MERGNEGGPGGEEDGEGGAYGFAVSGMDANARRVGEVEQ